MTNNVDKLRQIILKTTHKGPIVEYSFKDIAKPIGVSSYRVTRELPAQVRGELPSIQDLEGVVARLKSDLDQMKENPGDNQ